MATDKVVFRKFREGDIIALFPRIPADINGNMCESYQHIGQHGAADLHGVIDNTVYAIPKEYTALAKELRSIGYHLDIGKRVTETDNIARRKLAKKQWGHLK
jgi:hypothetical protein